MGKQENIDQAKRDAVWAEAEAAMRASEEAKVPRHPALVLVAVQGAGSNGNPGYAIYQELVVVHGPPLVPAQDYLAALERLNSLYGKLVGEIATAAKKVQLDRERQAALTP